MNENENTYALLTERLRDALRASFGDLFHEYFLGGPELIPEAALPCIIIDKISTKVTADGAATMTDDRTEQVLVHLLVNGKDGFGADDSEDMVAHQLELLVEGVDARDNQYLPSTILYAIRQNFTLNSTIIDHSESVSYATTTRKEQPTIREALITITALSRIFAPNRY